MNIIEYPDRDLLALDVAGMLAGELEAHLNHNPSASLVVPGGSTPGPIFDALCGARIAWENVHVLLSDERWVPENHPQSNAALIRERLLVDQAKSAQFTPFYQPNGTIGENATKLSETLEEHLPISVLVLGMGADMHTASLFPKSDGLELAMAPDAPVLCPIKVPGHDIDRITFSAPYLSNATSKHLIITGDEKRAALEQATKSDMHDAPVRAILNDATIHWAA